MAGDLARAIARRKRTLDKLHAWWDAALEAERIRSLADLIMIHHREIAPKSKAVALVDPSTGREEAISLVPSLDAIENAQRLYERAKRLRRGRPHVRSRIERLEREVRLVEEATRADAAGRPIDERALALVSQRPERARRGQAQSLLRVDEDGFAILVGRSALENDRLLRAAAPDDLWLHAKGFAGSHVIVRRGGRREIPEAVVRRAARLAAEHSKGRGERRVQVVVTEAKHVRKPKGGAPGLANVARGGTLTIEL